MTDHKTLDSLGWEAEVTVGFMASVVDTDLWMVKAVWHDYHGATLILNAEAVTIEEAALQIRRVKEHADAEWAK